MQEFNDLVKQAEDAMHLGDSETARHAYENILHNPQLHANQHHHAKNGIADVNKWEAKKAEIEVGIEEADQLMENGEYEYARRKYSSAVTACGVYKVLVLSKEVNDKLDKASDLSYWQKKVNKAIEEADELLKNDSLKQAGKQLEEVLQELNRTPFYDQFSSPILAAQQKVWQNEQTGEIEHHIQDAYARHDFQQVLAIASNADNHDLKERIASLVRNAERSWSIIAEKKVNVEARIADEDWSGASALISRARTGNDSPVWDELLLIVGMKHGKTLLVKGRNANGDNELNEAIRYFTDAETAFFNVMTKFPEHVEAMSLKLTAEDLKIIVGYEQQAQTDWNNDRRKLALGFLAQAEDRIATMRENGREYPVVVAVASKVASMRIAIKEELEHIKVDEHALSEGNRHKENKNWQKSKEEFEKIEISLLPEYSRQAGMALTEIEDALFKFGTYIEQGEKVSTIEQKIAFLRQAYELWPTSPDMPELLVDILLEAAELAVNDEDENQVKLYCTEVLDIDEHNRPAQLLKGKLSVQVNVEGTLQEVKNKLGRLAQSADTDAAEYDALFQKLDKARPKEKEYKDILAQVDALSIKIKQEKGQRQEFVNGRQQAQSLCIKGEWKTAVEELKTANSHLTPVPDSLQQQVSTWQAIANAVQQAEETWPQMLIQAQKLYDAIPESNEYEECSQQLATLRTDIKQLDEQAKQANGFLPQTLLGIDTQAKELQTRVTKLRDAVQIIDPFEAYDKIELVMEMIGTDETITAVATRLKEKREQSKAQRISKLLRQADAAAQDDDRENARGKLEEARKLDPDNQQIIQKLQQIKNILRIKKLVRQAFDDYESKASSPVDASEALKKGIKLLLQPNSGLSKKANTKVEDLLNLSSTDEGMAFGIPEKWEQAQSYIQELSKIRHDDLILNEAFFLVETWGDVEHDNSEEEYIASAKQLGELLDAFRVANKRRDRDPSDKNVKLFSDALEGVVKKANHAADKRLHRALVAIEDIRFADALNELHSLVEDFYGEINNEFPRLLEGRSDVEDRVARKEKLEIKAGKLQRVHDGVKPRYEEAQDAYFNNNFPEALLQLKGIPYLAEIPALEEDVDKLRQDILKAQQTHLAEALREGIDKAESRLKLAKTSEQIDEVMANLDTLPESFDFGLLPDSKKAEYNDLLVKIRDQREALVAGDIYFSRGEDSFAEKEYAKAIMALEEALARNRDGEKEPPIKLLLEDARNALNNQEKQNALLKERASLLEEGQSLLDQGRYADANVKLNAVQRQGIEVSALIKVAEAGELLQTARQYNKEGRLDDALVELTDLLETVDGVPEAKSIIRKAQRLQRNIERGRDSSETVRANLQEARIALRLGGLEKAQQLVKTVLQDDHGNVEAVELQDEIFKRQIVDERLKDVEKEFDDGHFDIADSMIKAIQDEMPDQRESKLWKERIRSEWAKSEFEKARILPPNQVDEAQSILRSILSTIRPDYPEAQTLLDQIGAKSKARTYLKRARTLAYDNKFKQAQEALAAVPQHEHDLDELLKVQEDVKEQERAWEIKSSDEIDAFVRRRKYKEAHRLSTRLVEQAADVDIHAKMEDRQRQVVADWVNDDVTKLQRQISESQKRNALAQIAQRLEHLMKLSPQPAPDEMRQLEDMLQETHTKRLELQVASAIKLKNNQQWEKAEQSLKNLQSEADNLQIPDMANRIQDELNKLHIDRLKQKMERAKLLQENQQWEKAIKLLEEVNDEAFDLRLSNLAITASNLIETVEMDKQQVEDQEWDAKMADHFSNISRLYEIAKSRSDLEQVNQKIRDIRKIIDDENIEDDRVFVWEKKSKQALTQFDTTERAIENARYDLEKQDFSSAESSLQAVKIPSLLLKPDYDELLEATRLLVLAQKAEKTDWGVAFQKYQEVLTELPALNQHLQPIVENARKEGLQSVVAEVNRLLHAVVPKPKHAESLLNKAELERLALPEDKSIRRLRNLIPDKQRVADAVQLLENDHIDPIQAEKLLRQAQLNLPSEELGEIEQWQMFAQSQRFWQEQEFKAADDELERMTEPVAARPKVKQLRRNVRGALEDEGTLRHFQEEIKQALGQTPPDYNNAVDFVHDAIDGLRRNPFFAQNLLQQVQERLYVVAQSARDKNEYAEALNLGRLLLLLPPNDNSIVEFVNGLKRERQERLDAALEQAQDGLQNALPHVVEKALRQAQTIASPEGDPRIVETRKRLAQLHDDIVRVDGLLKQVRKEWSTDNWGKAIKYVENAESTLPKYHDTAEEKELLRKRLYEQAESALRSELFSRAVSLGKLGKEIETTGEFTQLVSSGISRREERWVELRQKAGDALAAWNLDIAWQAIQQGLGLSPVDNPDHVLSNYDTAYEIKKKQAPDIRKFMEKGWEALRERNYGEAKHAFAQARDKATDFSEAQSWRDFTVNMEKGAQAVADTKFKEASRAFKDAESWLRIVEGSYLPSILNSENHLRQMRRQAVYDAHRLRENVQKMVETKTNAEDAYRRGNAEQSWELINDYKQQQTQFTAAHNTITSPPTDFDVGTTAVSQPQTVINQPVENGFASSDTKPDSNPLQGNQEPSVSTKSNTTSLHDEQEPSFSSVNDDFVDEAEPSDDTAQSYVDDAPRFDKGADEEHGTGIGTGWGTSENNFEQNSDSPWMNNDTVDISDNNTPPVDYSSQKFENTPVDGFDKEEPVSSKPIFDNEPASSSPDVTEAGGVDDEDFSMSTSWSDMMGGVDVATYDEEEEK